MSESSSPLLVISAPEGHELDPQAWEALRQCAGESYGAGVMLAVPAFLNARLPLLLGDWDRSEAEVLRDLTPLITAAFFNLDWLEGVI